LGVAVIEHIAAMVRIVHKYFNYGLHCV
jgi:hypothetical protein